MQRSDLSRIYAEQRLAKTQSTKGNDHRGGTPRAYKHDKLYAPKPDPFKHIHAPEKPVVAIKKHTHTPYEGQQLQIVQLQDLLKEAKRHHRQFIKSMILVLDNNTIEFTKQLLESELRKVK